MALHTPLCDEHVDAGAKLCDFAGYDMPLYYKDGAIKEHMAVRERCGLFDVSHMGQIVTEGEGAAAFWERATPSSFADTAIGVARYTVLLNEKGGIIDDLIVTRIAEKRFFAVINAGCKHKDVAHLRALLPSGVTLTELTDRALIAVQGPEAERAMQDALSLDLSELEYMRLAETGDLYVSRLGYTGEDGFEISVPSDRAASLWRALASQPGVSLAGLAARDGLRLEMGYPLYGHDVDDATTPLEANLSWVVSKKNTTHIGAKALADQRANGVAKKRVGIRFSGKTIAREGAEISDESGAVVGALTSGGFSPVLQCGIGQAYVPLALSAPGTSVSVAVRGKPYPATVCALAFLPSKTKTPSVRASIP
ncbi:MAG: glycine cleavage system aminomethyltransferase GcvT [Rickettsiales bacterium]